jgi:pilus assembly protein CpaC
MTRMIKRLLIVFGLVLLVGPHAWAAASTPLKLSVDHGVSLTLSSPASSVFIANPDIADVQVMSPTSIMIFGKRTGETTFMASDTNGHTLAQRTIMVIQDLSDLRLELDNAIPGNKIKIQALPNGLVLTGEVKDPGAAADAYKLAQRYLSSGGDIINRIKVVGSNQIHIRVRFAEVQRNIDTTLGIDWQTVSTGGGMVFGLGTGSIVNALGGSGGTLGTGAATGLFPRPNNTTLSQPNDVLGVQRIGKHFDIQGMIDALAQDGLITILAEPNLTAMSGETASFLAGGEFPIPIPQGNGTISIEFKKYGVSLEFTPTLISENRINLHVKPEVSELTQTGAIVTDNITVPALTTRKAETTIEVGSGESFAIAGLLDNNQAQTVTKYPLLGDLPVIGALFRSEHFINGQTELVVIITPYIVKPTGEQMALPMDSYSPPNATEQLVGQRYSSSDPNARHMSGDPVGQPSEPPVVQAPMLQSPTSDMPASPAASPVTEVIPAPSNQSPVLHSEATIASPSGSTPPPVVTTPIASPTTAATVTTVPTPLVSINQAKTASAPLRGTSNSTPGGPTPVGPGGFIVE